MERTAELARQLFRRSEAGARVGAPRLVVLSGQSAGRSLDIPAPIARVLIGRGETCQLVLPDPDVSREHAEVVHDLDGVVMRNLESKNGLSINGQTVSHRRLRDGDELLFGTTRLLFEEPAEEPIDALGSEADRALSKPPPVSVQPATAAAAPVSAPAPAGEAAPSLPSACPSRKAKRAVVRRRRDHLCARRDRDRSQHRRPARAHARRLSFLPHRTRSTAAVSARPSCGIARRVRRSDSSARRAAPVVSHAVNSRLGKWRAQTMILSLQGRAGCLPRRYAPRAQMWGGV